MESNSADENSDDGLHIVIESPRSRKRTRHELDDTDKNIIACVEKALEENLEEKAAKANLTTKNVKNIIKEVVTNEHVIALVRHAENPDDSIEPVYEPKYTRAKTKELLSTNAQPNILPWVPSSKSVSEVHMLFSEELQEDSSGDEYVPDRKNKKGSSFESKLNTSQESLREEEANIALRTRSKLSLSHTPLEVIEEAFMPPDITTDMYDMNCDDDVWKEFLKTFTRPLDEVTKAAEDEDHDPEYNVLADEEIDKVDKEELRADRAVTVSRKEFNCLMAELFEFADIYESNKQNEKQISDSFPSENCDQVNKANESDLENDPNISIKKCQIPLLAQQMRQHVQMLTQSFLLSYDHPEFSDMATKFKELLTDLKMESEEKTASIYHAVNLVPALNLIESWETLFETKTKEVLDHKQYVEKVIVESIAAKQAGTEYIVTFSPLLLKTISNSDVFIYTSLLPRIPFKSLNITRSHRNYFTNSEENLIALFMEQAIPWLKQNTFHLTNLKKVNMQHVCQYIHKLLMPHVNPAKIRKIISQRNRASSLENPIKYFYRNRKVPPTVHYVMPLDSKSILPPCQKSPDLLPYQWREYIYPSVQKEKKVANSGNKQVIILTSPLQLWPLTSVTTPVPVHVNFANKTTRNRNVQRKIEPRGPLIPVTNHIQKTKSHTVKTLTKICKNSFKENSVLTVTNQKTSKMLPDMPSLSTPVKSQATGLESNAEKDNNADTNSKKEQNLSFQNIANLGFQFYKPETKNETRRNFEGISEFSTAFSSQNETSAGMLNRNSTTEKDNPDDINDLMIASSTVKNITKKEPSGAEKKRAKIRREFIANLVMATPDDRETENQKEENFVDSFFDKLRQTLTVEHYNKLIEILSHYDENNGEFLDLYKNVQSILSPAYSELSEEFLLFLTDIQAQRVGQLMSYFVMKDMHRFIKKLQIYFKEQPSQMKKIIKCLTDLSENPSTTMENVRSTVLPLFKGNAALTDWFLQLFPCERPPKVLSSRPHEVMDLSKELARQPDEDIYETVVLPDTEDPYGGLACICTCHNVENPQFKLRSQHCIQCGLKFIQGKIYIQTGKALRPAVVSFLTNPEKDHTERLTATATQRKRSETSPSKQVVSPNKDNQTHEEHRNSNDSDDECDGTGKKKTGRQFKAQRKRKIKQRHKPNVKDSEKLSNKESAPKTCDKVISNNAKPRKKSSRRQNKKKNTSLKKSPGYKPGSNSRQQKRLAEQEIEYSEPAELIELKVSSDHSGESETEFFESSQDVTNTDSEDSGGSPHLSPLQESESQWSREEDKIILQTFRQRRNNEETFKHISEVLQNRSVVEIKSRFHKLMSLLQQMATTSNS